MHTRVLLCAALATIAVYWVGLSGPFLFDDGENFAALQRWLSGQASWQEVIPGHASWLYARPVSMASFMLTGWLGGGGPLSFKLGNLIVHLACGLVGWQVLRRALAQDARLSARADLIASLLAGLWLLHPLHASTVLYAVQRMAQLSTLFVLASVWVYFNARRQLLNGRTRRALAHLFLLCPLMMAAAVFSKQNGAVAPALCLVVELAYFTGQSRHRAVPSFFAIFLLLPALAATALLLVAPDRLLGGYADWDFTLGQRLLTQPRALFDYIGTLLLPYGPRMGLYTDDFVVSTGLLSPPTTLLALLALAAISIAAIALRRRAPSVFAGWFFFLVAHGVESTFLPLEMYYEHRNYLPAVGLLLAVAGLGALAPKPVAGKGTDLRRLALVAVAALALAYSFATLGRALVWRHYDTIVAQALKYHPDSLRAHLDQSTLALLGGRYDESTQILTRLAHSDNPRHRLLANINLITTDCLRGGQGKPAYLRKAVADAASRVTISEVHTLRFLVKITGTSACQEVSDAQIATGITALVDRAASQPESARTKWMTRFLAAQVYARGRDWRNAQAQAEIAWQASSDLAVGAFLAQMYSHNGRPQAAKAILAVLEQRVRHYDSEGSAELRQIRSQLDLPASRD